MDKVILISVDALSESDWEHIVKLKNFKRFLNDGVYTKKLKSVFPTLTYVIHTTMVTGVYPDKHGVIHNYHFEPFMELPKKTWYWYRNEIKHDTIYDYVKRNGGKVASLLWPVTSGSSIRYNLPEILAINNENQVLKVLKNGSTGFIVGLELKFSKSRVSMQQPHLDDYITDASVHTIRSRKPDLTMIHLVNIDAAKHRSRVESDYTINAFSRMDANVGKILDTADDDTTIILLGDHGQINIDYSVHINNLFYKAGLIYKEADEYKYNAYMQTGGGSAYLHINDEKYLIPALNLLEEAEKSGNYGIERIYYKQHMEHMHIPGIVGGIEAKAGYRFDETITDNTVDDYLKMGKPYADHGYNPDKPGYGCVFMAMGKHVNKKGEIPPFEMVDIAPTVLKLMGLDGFVCDGKPIL